MKIDGKFIIDTNILIYAIDRSSKFYKFSRELIEDNNELIITSKNLAEFVAVLSKMNLYNVIKNEINKIIQNFNIIYASKKSIEIFVGMIEQYKPSGNRVYDFEIVSIMK